MGEISNKNSTLKDIPIQFSIQLELQDENRLFINAKWHG